MSQAGRKALLVLTGHVAGAALGYVVLLLVGRYIDPRSYGAYVFAVNLVGLVALLTNLGLGTAHQRHIAMGTPVGHALGVLVRMRLLLVAGFLVALAVGTLAWSALGGASLTDATTPAVLMAALGLQLLTGTRQVLLDTWAGQQRFNRVETVRFLDSATAVVALANAALAIAHLTGRWSPLPGLGAFWAERLHLRSAPSLEQAALLLAGAYLAGKLLSLLVAAVWAAGDKVRLGPWDLALARSYARFALPVALTGALGVILAYTDSLVLGFFFTAREVGWYGAAQKLAVLASLVGATAGTVLFPRFAQLHSQGDAGNATFQRAERYLLLLCAPIAAALVALPREVLHIAVGDQYLAAAPALRWLVLAAVVLALEQPMTARFLANGRARYLVHSAALNVLLNVALNLLLVPRQGPGLGLGPKGAAVATLASSLVSYAYLRWRTRSEQGHPWIAGRQLPALLAAAAMGGGLAWAAARLPAAFDRVWELAAWCMAAGAAYLVVVAVLGGIRRDDRDLLVRVLHPGALLDELRGR